MPSCSPSESQKTPALYRDPNLRIVFAITLMAVLGVSSITPAFPRIARAFGLPSQAVGGLITAFTLPGVVLTPVLGVLADRWGRKRLLIPSLMVFGLAGGACSLVRDFELLLALRFAQGIGAASLSVLYITLIGDLYRGESRTVAMGYNAGVVSLGTAIYPLIGGALATLGWAYPFVLPVLALPIGILVLFGLENPEPKVEQRLRSYLEQAWDSIRHPQAVALFALTLLTFVIIYGAYLTYLPFLMESAFRASPLAIGIAMSGMSLATALTSSQLGKLTKLGPQRSLLRASWALFAAALATIPLAPTLWALGIPILLLGLAQGLSIPNLQTLLASLAPIEHRGAFLSINGMILRLGQTLGPPLMGLVSGVWGIDSTFYASAGIAAGMLVLTMTAITAGEGEIRQRHFPDSES